MGCHKWSIDAVPQGVVNGCMRLTIILCLLVVGCAYGPYWERTWDGALTVEVREVDFMPWPNVHGWAACDKVKRHCVLVVSTNAPSMACTERHERKHAAGFDHPQFTYNIECASH